LTFDDEGSTFVFLGLDSLQQGVADARG